MNKRLTSLLVTTFLLVGMAGTIAPASADRGDRGRHRSEDAYAERRPRGREYVRPHRGESEDIRYGEADSPRGRGRSRGRGVDATIERLREETGARILSTERYGEGRDTYRIRILTPEGRVRRLLIDGESGRLLHRRR